MSTVGIDLEQFIRDPYATGIQRVLQQLAMHWPAESRAEFVLPLDDGTFLLINQVQATELLTLPFLSHQSPEPGFDANHQLRLQVADWVQRARDDRSTPRVRLGQLVSLYDSWLLPEVSYLPSVLERLDIFGRSMPVTMIGYDALPMTDPGNYRFVPGSGSNVSEYFRRLATAEAVVCISDYSRTAILDRLRRDRSRRTTIAHPGGDHLEPRPKNHVSSARPQFVRLGTMEARKRPLEILAGFQRAVRQGLEAELLFIGNPNASADAVNRQVMQAVEDGYPVTWIHGVSDAEVYDLVHGGDAFLSIGTEGYGIPVLEAIRLGTPVLYDGIQPAGDLMQGKGAARVPAMDHASLTDLFLAHGSPGGLERLSQELEPSAVPTWRDFAVAVAQQSTQER